MNNVTDLWKVEEKECMHNAYLICRESHDFLKVSEIAERKGFRIADGFDRMNLSPADLYIFAGTVWVKIDNKEIAEHLRACKDGT
ncbi:hypothetical protein [Duffyella gerundensis]|uniref:hypothetical protein n=1 Tax=Duffyella TaxID=3026546 RepID=UPI003F6DD87F